MKHVFRYENLPLILLSLAAIVLVLCIILKGVEKHLT